MTSIIDTVAVALLCLRPMTVPGEDAMTEVHPGPAPCHQPATESTRQPDLVGPDSATVALPWSLRLVAYPAVRTSPSELLQDPVRRRGRAVVHSDAYFTRVTIHRRLAYGMIPLFALSYFSGDQLMKSGPEAPSWARTLHGPSATGVAILFGANAITGSWNLWEGRHDAEGRTRRLLHATLFMAASGGFAYSGAVLADEAETSASKRSQHRNVNLWSMGVATTSWLLMLIPRQ